MKITQKQPTPAQRTAEKLGKSVKWIGLILLIIGLIGYARADFNFFPRSYEEIYQASKLNTDMSQQVFVNDIRSEIRARIDLASFKGAEAFRNNEFTEVERLEKLILELRKKLDGLDDNNNDIYQVRGFRLGA